MKPNVEKILQHGFTRDGANFIRREKFLQDFTLTITISERGAVTTNLNDADGEPYTLHLVAGAGGSFVGTIRAEHERILNEILEQCFDAETFRAAQTLRLIEFIREKFSDEPEFLWEKFPNNAIFRRADNRKWYAVLLTIPRSKLQLDGDEELEILDVRVEPAELDRLVDGEKYFRGWHMNKKSWMTLRLDDCLTDAELHARLTDSYRLAAKK